MLKLAVVGKDVSQSRSPAIHIFILEQFGKKTEFDALSVPPERFSVRAQGLFSEYDAFFVTIPFKGEILPYLHKTEGDATAFGAVNLVVSHTRTGYNTDGAGFFLMLQSEGISPSGKRVLVLGAGGAGRSCIRTFVGAGAETFVYERDEERLREVYRALGGFSPLTEIPLAEYDLIINCTGVGMHRTVGKTPVVALEGGRFEPVGAQLLAGCEMVIDLIYEPKESEFLRLAKSLQKRTVNGAAMLFYQAYFGDCILLGRQPSVAEARELYTQFQEKGI